MDRPEFDQLCADVNEYYEEANQKTYAEHVLDCIYEKPKFTTLEDAMFFVLFQKKNDLIYGSLGAVFNMDGSSAHLNYNNFNKLLEKVLGKKKSSRFVKPPR